MYPHYSYPAHVKWGLVRDALLDRNRTFADDARACAAQLHPPLHFLGVQHIPPEGRYVITPNHYSRPGFGAQWSAIAISAIVPGTVHWVMTGEFTYPGSWCAPLAQPISRLVLARIARVYGFTTMPPMPPRQHDTAACASSVRRVLRYAARRTGVIVGLAPEGGIRLAAAYLYRRQAPGDFA